MVHWLVLIELWPNNQPGSVDCVSKFRGPLLSKQVLFCSNYNSFFESRFLRMYFHCLCTWRHHQSRTCQANSFRPESYRQTPAQALVAFSFSPVCLQVLSSVLCAEPGQVRAGCSAAGSFPAPSADSAAADSPQRLRGVLAKLHRRPCRSRPDVLG
jgi:hypothetical protein